jgi:hypothetical protein
MLLIVLNIFLILLAFGIGFLGIMSSNPLVTIACSFGALFIAFQLPEPQDIDENK